MRQNIAERRHKSQLSIPGYQVQVNAAPTRRVAVASTCLHLTKAILICHCIDPNAARLYMTTIRRIPKPTWGA